MPRKSGRDVVGRVIVIGRYGCSVYNHAEFPECHVSIAEKLQIVVKTNLNIILIIRHIVFVPFY